ncbi:uncharacterized protein si:ch211-67f24.7 [Trichomycterus rosablanca]|uniref:uncharacterized protein si:ch211-67f24.7 n=1 Tax=Trichomycterus rosablanca TaxID=2290929 RepID=UPI002F35301B
MMKSHEGGELVREISKLQAMVLELRSGFSRALLELNQIQLGDTELQSQLEETRHGCNKRSLHLETIILSLKEELEEIRRQIRQICDKQVKAEQKTNSTVPQSNSAASCSVKDVSSNTNGYSDQVATPLCSVGGALLLHCYLQGLWAGHNSGEALSQVSLRAEGPSASCTLPGRRQRVSVSLLKSEWDYVSKLNLLQEKYKTSTAGHHVELHKVFVKHVEQMLQRHLVFRNCLQDKLSRDQPSAPLGDAFLQLTSQQNSGICDGYLGYTAALATILTTEFSRDPPEKTQNTPEGEKEKFRLLSLLLAPIIRLHTYLNTVQLLLSCSGREHSDWCSLQETDQILRNLYTRCHMTLERAGRWTDGVGRQNEGVEPTNSLSSRCCEESSGCARSAFTKYRANPRTGTANCHATINTQQREHCQVAAPQPLLPPAGILRNSSDRAFEPPSGWTENCMWDLPAVECHSLPRRPQHLFLNPGAPGAVGELSGSVPNLKSPSGLVERLCGSPGPDGRVCRSDVYSLPQQIDDGDTDADVGDTSVFDYSSVTTCSPDDTLELRGRDEEDDEEEDSEIPVLLKPSYNHTHSGGAAQRDGSVCARWQIPRAVPLPPELCVGGTGTSRRTAKHRRKMPTSAFRPIWDSPYKQGDAAPAKETTVCFSNTNQIINPQPPTDPQRSMYRSVCSGDRAVIWNESEDSEGPCSNV